MAFKVLILLSGVALCCSFADANMTCLFGERTCYSAPSLIMTRSSFSQPRRNLTITRHRRSYEDEDSHFQSSSYKSKDWCCYDWELEATCCTKREAITNWSIKGIAVFFIILLLTPAMIMCCRCCACVCSVR